MDRTVSWSANDKQNDELQVFLELCQIFGKQVRDKTIFFYQWRRVWKTVCIKVENNIVYCCDWLYRSSSICVKKTNIHRWFLSNIRWFSSVTKQVSNIMTVSFEEESINKLANLTVNFKKISLNALWLSHVNVLITFVWLWVIQCKLI